MPSYDVWLKQVHHQSVVIHEAFTNNARKVAVIRQAFQKLDMGRHLNPFKDQHMPILAILLRILWLLDESISQTC
jgi:hypothetical protein